MMPYIKKEARQTLDLDPWVMDTPGELNYVLTKFCLEYLGNSPNYQRFNDVLGAMEGAKLELYRRRVAPYEDLKIVENGDVGV